MIILRPYENRVLPIVPRSEWMEPSQACEKDQFNNDGYRVRFHAQHRLDDGHVRWHGIFRDRDDWDAFLWALARGTLKTEPALWRLPTPHWHPDLDTGRVQIFVTITITGSTGVDDVSGTLPADWNPSLNTIHAVGGGGSGGAAKNNGNRRACGGGGGMYKYLTNYSGAPGSTYYRRVGARGPGKVVTAAASSASGNAGSSSYFKNASYTIVLNASNGGGGQAAASATARSGGTAGSGGTGTGGYNGGSGGDSTGTAAGTLGTGGGGAGGSSGAGSDGVSGGGGAGGTAGGSGGAGSYSGNGGAGRTLTAAGGNGYDGTDYGAGGGGINTDTGSSITSGDGAQGILELIYTPPVIPFNIAMIGM